MDFVAVVIVDRVVVGLAMIRGGYSSGQSKGCTQGKEQGNGEHGVDFGFDSDDEISVCCDDFFAFLLPLYILSQAGICFQNGKHYQ